MRDSSNLISVPMWTTCPNCGDKGTWYLVFIPEELRKKGRRPLQEARCRCDKCEKYFTIHYYIWKTKQGLYRIRVLKCVYDDTSISKRFRLVQP